MTQPILIDDMMIVEGELSMIEEIISAQEVVIIRDLRPLVAPLSCFIEKPVQNWTREGAALIGVVYFYLDYRAPISAIREKLKEFVEQSKFWNRKVVSEQVTDADEYTMDVRGVMSADNAGQTWNLGCEVREKMIDFLQSEVPEALSRQRVYVALAADSAAQFAPDENGSQRGINVEHC